MARGPDAALGPEKSFKHLLTDQRIVAAMRIAEAQTDVFVTTSALAKAVGLSQFHFVRLFHEQVGETVSEYIRRIRLDDAAMRLRWSSEPVVSIALSVGYGSQAAFTRAFTARFRVSPAQYRRSNDVGFSYPADERSVRDVTVRKIRSFSCLGRRYLGSYELAAERWSDFLKRLPASLRSDSRSRYISISYDNARITPIDQLRHDCCVVPPASSDVDCRRTGLQTITTTGSMYAASMHAGAYASVNATYGLILDRWLKAQTRYQIRSDVGAMELHLAPPDQDASQSIVCEVLMPVYADGMPGHHD